MFLKCSFIFFEQCTRIRQKISLQQNYECQVLSGAGVLCANSLCVFRFSYIKQKLIYNKGQNLLSPPFLLNLLLIVESSAQNILLVLWKDPFGFVTAELTQNKENKSESRVALQRALQLRKYVGISGRHSAFLLPTVNVFPVKDPFHQLSVWLPLHIMPLTFIL